MSQKVRLNREVTLEKKQRAEKSRESEENLEQNKDAIKLPRLGNLMKKNEL